MLKKDTAASFVYYDVRRRTKKKEFFRQIDSIINWTKISQTLNKNIKRSKLDAYGRPAYAPITLFKMMLLQTWYKLSDEGVEEMVNDTLSANEFCGLKIEDTVPDHSTLSRFRKELTDVNLMDKLLNKINRQLKKHQVIVKEGSAVIDATITESPWKDRIPTYQISEDREEEEEEEDEIENGNKKEENPDPIIIKERIYRKGVDEEGRWLRKGKKTYYGYKQHVASNKEGIILGVHTVQANEYEGKGLKPLLRKLLKEHKIEELSTDKGYSSKKNREILKELKLKDRLQHKAKRNRPLSKWSRRFNKAISKYRYVIERTFGSCKKWFDGGIARYKSLCKVHTQHVMQAIAYNLKRSPGIIMSNPN